MEIKGTDEINSLYDFINCFWVDYDTSEGKAFEMMNYSEYTPAVTFDEVLAEAKKRGFTEGVLYVMAMAPLRGKIYQYGNYGAEWYEVGETRGYA